MRDLKETESKYVHKLTKTLTSLWLVSLPNLNPCKFWTIEFPKKTVVVVVIGISVWAGCLEVLESGVAVVKFSGLSGFVFEVVNT